MVLSLHDEHIVIVLLVLASASEGVNALLQDVHHFLVVKLEHWYHLVESYPTAV